MFYGNCFVYRVIFLPFDYGRDIAFRYAVELFCYRFIFGSRKFSRQEVRMLPEFGKIFGVYRPDVIDLYIIRSLLKGAQDDIFVDIILPLFDIIADLKASAVYDVLGLDAGRQVRLNLDTPGFYLGRVLGGKPEGNAGKGRRQEDRRRDRERYTAEYPFYFFSDLLCSFLDRTALSSFMSDSVCLIESISFQYSSMCGSAPIFAMVFCAWRASTLSSVFPICS